MGGGVIWAWAVVNAVPIVFTIYYIAEAFGRPDAFLRSLSIEERRRRRGRADLRTWIFCAMLFYGSGILGWHAAGGALMSFMPEDQRAEGLYPAIAGIGALFGVGVLLFAEKYPARHIAGEAERVLAKALVTGIMSQRVAEGRDEAIQALDELIAREEAKTWDVDSLSEFVRERARVVRGHLDMGRYRP